MLNLSLIKNIYGDVINYDDFCRIIQDYAESNYNPILESLTDYVPVWKVKNNFGDINTSVTTKYSVRSNDDKNGLTVIVTFSTVEKFMPTEWRTLDKEERQRIRMLTFSRRIRNFESFTYSEGTTLMGQCKWLISYVYRIPVPNTKEMKTDEIGELLNKMNVELT